MMETNPFVERNPIVKTVTRHLARTPHTFRPEIAADDEMFLYQLEESEDRNSDRALVYYYCLGKAIVDSIRQIVNAHFGSFAGVSSFLDFACGYGRSTRFLVQEMPPENVWVSDIYPGAVKFQMETFGVNGIFSTHKPEDYPADKKFDCIYAGSFFSHMPPPAFKLWMRRLYDLLTPEGLLIFSVLDEALMPPNARMLPEGIVFSADSGESRFLDRSEYGTTYVTAPYIRQLVDKISQNQAEIYRFKKGLNHYQDLYAVAPKASVSLQNIKFSCHPEGCLDAAKIKSNGNLYLKGWAVDFNPGSGIKTVQMIANNRLIQQCQTHFKRPDLVGHFNRREVLDSGWCCEMNSHQISPEDILLIRAVNFAGLEWIIEADFVKSLVSQSRWKSHLISLQTELQQMGVKFNELRGQLNRTECELERSRAERLQVEERLGKTEAELDSVRVGLAEWEAKFSQTEERLRETEAELDGLRTALGQYEAKLSQTEAELGKCRGEGVSNRVLLERAESRIRAMESSKFWKLRTKWFKLKRAVGLSDND